MNPLNQNTSSAMTLEDLQVLLDPVYALLGHTHTGVYSPVGHAHVIGDVTGLQAALNAKLSLSGGTMTGALNFLGSGILDEYAGSARIFSSGSLLLQANGGQVAIPSGGSECFYIYSDGHSTFENATTFATKPTLELLERGSQLAPLFKAGSFTVARYGEPKHPIYSGASDPTSSNFAASLGGWWKNTTSGEIRFWYNDGGTLKKSAALT